MNRHRPSFASFLTIILAALLIAACGPATGDLGGVATPPLTEQPSLEIPSEEPTPGTSANPEGTPGATPGSTPGATPGSTPGVEPTPGGTTTIRVYFFLGSFVDNAGLVPVLREIPKTPAVGSAAMDELLKGPNDDEMGARPAMYTTIPEGTRFLGLAINDGVATVDLSREFESGGGSASVLGRLAQVVYTLTQFPTVKGVKFELDGEPVGAFSGEGVILDQAVDRDDYLDQLPTVFVDRPAWGGVLANPARISGVANAFEATFQARIANGEGRVLAQKAVMATCGTGCWGTFDERIPYTVANAGWGTLQVYELSAKDGSVVNLTEYPVWLTP
jgi:hypothetical protein